MTKKKEPSAKEYAEALAEIKDQIKQAQAKIAEILPVGPERDVPTIEEFEAELGSKKASGKDIT